VTRSNYRPPQPKRRTSVGLLIVMSGIVAAVAAVPWFGGNYSVSLLFFLFLSVVMASTYDITAGYMGYINLSHGAFFGIGAYAYAISIAWSGGGLLGLLLAVMIPPALAAIISLPLFRLRDAYFAIAAFGVLKLMQVLASNLRDLTGGSTGLSIPPTDSTVITYYAALLLCLMAIALNAWIANSRMGLALLTIREDEEVSETSGINTVRLKSLALILSAALPGLAGAVYMWQTTYIDPDSAFGASVAFAPVIMAMLGGSGTVLGPLIGALFITVVQEVLWSRVGYLQLAMYGVVLVGVGVIMPGGILRNRLVSRIYAAIGLPDHYGYRPSRDLQSKAIAAGEE
jgi:branched-chain amino acid transport system permease protein